MAGGPRARTGEVGGPAGATGPSPHRPRRERLSPDGGPGSRRWQGALALLLFLALSLLLLGRQVLPHLSRRYLGVGADPTVFIWYLAWWPRAVLSGRNPLITDLLWAPHGVNLAGGNPVPALGLAAAPLTAALGPVAAFNVLMLLALPLSAWAAYLLCRRVTGSFWPSVVGGYVFGFSTYELGRALGHLNLAMVPLVPVAVLLVLRRVQGSLAPRAFVALLAGALALQLLISPEVWLSLSLFGGAALAVALAVATPPSRPAVWAAGRETAGAYLIAGAALSPYLAAAVATAGSRSPIWDFYPTFFSADLLNFVVPTPLTLIGSDRFAGVAARFTGNLSEQGAYLGVPLLAVAVAVVAGRWRSAEGRILGITLGLVMLMALGPRLHVAGVPTVPLPWRAFLSVPFSRYALPARFVVHAFLIVGVATALWLARAGARAWARWPVALLGVALLAPNPRLPVWSTAVDTPPFFATGLHRAYLRPGEVVLVVPYGDRGHSMLWQAQAGMDFRMAGGYVNVVPPEEFARWPILQTLYDGTLAQGYRRHLREFLRANRVGAVVVREGYPGPWEELFEGLGPPRRVGGVVLYDVPGAAAG